MNLSFGYSPCPNDTFMFNAIHEQSVSIAGCAIKEQLFDVQTLNEMALKHRLDITKLSFYAYLKVKDQYRLLKSGAALGYGSGPVLISKKKIQAKGINRMTIVIPGEYTTAHLLFRLWAPNAKKRIFTTYDTIFDYLETGKADCGVIIHESRFTFKEAGFLKLMDLGAWWEEKTGMPIPLGGIAAKKSLGEPLILKIENLVRQSIEAANRHPEKTLPYVRQYAQEIKDRIMEKHIQTFVNDFSLDLGNDGRSAIDMLEKMASKAGII